MIRLLPRWLTSLLPCCYPEKSSLHSSAKIPPANPSPVHTTPSQNESNYHSSLANSLPRSKRQTSPATYTSPTAAVKPKRTHAGATGYTKLFSLRPHVDSFAIRENKNQELKMVSVSWYGIDSTSIENWLDIRFPTVKKNDRKLEIVSGRLDDT